MTPMSAVTAPPQGESTGTKALMYAVFHEAGLP
jgi:hypothetical protein